MNPNPLRVIAAGLDGASKGNIALIADGARFTYAELASLTFAMTKHLARRGVHSGTRVALVATNRVETVIAIHALIEIGAVIVSIHPRFTEAEAQVIVANVAPCISLADADLVLDRETAQTLEPLPPALAGDALAILHTSGTTGSPKGAVLTRRAFHESAIASAENLGHAPRDRWLLCMPLCHVGGLSILTRCLVARSAVVLEPRFQADSVLASIAENEVTLLSVVPTMLRALLDADERGVLATLRAILVGGASIPLAWLDECGRRGIPALTTYGLTEACSQVTAQRLVPRDRGEIGSGHVLGSTRIRIACDDEDDGTIGRILVCGPTLMRGYYGEPPLPFGSWFDTGDVGEISENGALIVHARRTDLIVTGGENVYPVEVERALESCTNVARALVFGVNDERWGALVAVVLVLRAGASLDHALFADEIAARLAAHKRPRRFAIAAEIPLTPAGKVDRAGASVRFAASLSPIAYAPTAGRALPEPRLESGMERTSSDR